MASSSRVLHLSNGKRPHGPICNAREWGNASVKILGIFNMNRSPSVVRCEECLDKLALIELKEMDL